MAPSTYVVPETLRIQLAGLFLLKELSEQDEPISYPLEEDHRVLQPIIEDLEQKKYILLTDMLVLSPMGEEILSNFLQRYEENLEEFDIYCSVDLEEGEFAFSYFDDFEDPNEWQEFLNQDRWEDLRIAVAEYKGLDPVEMVFMNYVEDHRFGRDENGTWSTDWLLGKVWEEIALVCNSALRLNSLAYEENKKLISADLVIKDIIEQAELIRS